MPDESKFLLFIVGAKNRFSLFSINYNLDTIFKLNSRVTSNCNTSNVDYLYLKLTEGARWIHKGDLNLYSITVLHTSIATWKKANAYYVPVFEKNFKNS